MVAQPPSLAPEPPPWLLIAQGELGVHERPGVESDARIREYFRVSHVPDTYDDSSLAWCAIFANFCLHAASIHVPLKWNARSFLDWGVPLLRPRLGCVMVYSRPPDRSSGHVTFFMRQNDTDHDADDCLGGNQHNQVCVEAEPRARLLGMRWPSGYSLSSP